jgi:hypothetical protein
VGGATVGARDESMPTSPLSVAVRHLLADSASREAPVNRTLDRLARAG